MRNRSLPLLLLALAACGTEGADGEVRAGDCGQPDDKVVAIAIEEFLRVAQPRAYRYLLPVSGDTVLPEPARAALQMKGQTFLYPPDTTQQKKVLQQLSDIGPFATMVVAYRGTRLVTPDSALVTFVGHYVPIRGMKPADTTRAEIPVSCQVIWKLSRTVKKDA